MIQRKAEGNNRVKGKRIVFVDFDGTVTQEETLIGALMSVIPDILSKEKFEKVGSSMRTGDMTLSEGIHSLFDGMDASAFETMKAYMDTVDFRPGFIDFLESMKRQEVPVVLLSGGLETLILRVYILLMS